MRKHLIVWLACLILLAGCARPQTNWAPDPAPEDLRLDKFPVDLDHDHARAELHKASLGLERIAGFKTGHGASPNAPVYNLGLARNTLVASLGTFAPAGGALVAPMGLLLADVADVKAPKVQSVLEFPGAGVESVAINDDAKYAFVGTEFTGAVGIWTVDINDKSNPKPVAFTPLATEGPHNLRFGMFAFRQLVFASVAHVATAASVTGQQDPLPVFDLRVDIFEFDPAMPNLPLKLLSTYTAQDAQGVGPTNIVHDAVYQVHRLTGQPLLYVAHWDRGVRIVDLTDLGKPVEIGKYVDPAPTSFLTIHTVKPHPTILNGRHITVATSQCAYTPSATCHVRILDTTDPTQPKQVGTWTLPEEVHGALYTTEIFDLADGKILVPWAHAGVWALDISTPERLVAPATLGYHFVSEPSMWSGGARVPYSNAVIIKDGHALVADVNTGIHVLALPTGRDT